MLAISYLAIFLSYLSLLIPGAFKFSKSDARLVYICIIALFSLSISIRMRGWDVELYKNIFGEINAVNLDSLWLESGFVKLVSLFKSVGMGFEFFSFFFGFFTLAITLLAIKRILLLMNVGSYGSFFNAVLVYMSFYFIRGPYGQIRQAASMALILFAVSLLPTRKTAFTIVCLIVLASFFHSVAYVAIPSIIAAYFSARYFHKSLGLVFIFLAGILGSEVVVSQLILPAAELVSASVAYKLSFYQQNQSGYSGYLSLELLRWLILVYVIYPYIKNEFSVKFIFFYFIIGVSIYLLLSWDLRLASRVSRPMILVEVALWAYALRVNRMLPYALKILFLYLIFSIFLLFELFMLYDGRIIYGF